MTERDLEELKAKVIENKINTFDYLCAVNRYNETDLLHAGYRNKGIAEAQHIILNNAIKCIDKLHKDYIKKYPD